MAATVRSAPTPAGSGLIATTRRHRSIPISLRWQLRDFPERFHFANRLQILLQRAEPPRSIDPRTNVDRRCANCKGRSKCEHCDRKGSIICTTRSRAPHRVSNLIRCLAMVPPSKFDTPIRSCPWSGKINGWVLDIESNGSQIQWPSHRASHPPAAPFGKGRSRSTAELCRPTFICGSKGSYRVIN